MQRTAAVALALGWLARMTAVGLALFWGAFFVEHLQEWFLDRAGPSPPWQVWAGQLLHLVMLAGLCLIVVYPRLGIAVTVVGTASFFGWIGARPIPAIALLNLIPVIAMTACLMLRSGRVERAG